MDINSFLNAVHAVPWRMPAAGQLVPAGNGGGTCGGVPGSSRAGMPLLLGFCLSCILRRPGLLLLLLFASRLEACSGACLSFQVQPHLTALHILKALLACDTSDVHVAQQCTKYTGHSLLHAFGLMAG